MAMFIVLTAGTHVEGIILCFFALGKVFTLTCIVKVLSTKYDIYRPLM